MYISFQPAPDYGTPTPATFFIVIRMVLIAEAVYHLATKSLQQVLGPIASTGLHSHKSGKRR